MTGDKHPLERRQFLRIVGAAGVAVPFSSLLTACVGDGGTSNGGSAPAGKVTSDNPFGAPKSATVDAVIFDGGYGTDYFEFAGDIYEKRLGGKVELTATTEVIQQMQPRFAGGSPPDLLDNSGADKIPWTQLLEQVEDLNEVVDTENLEGKVIRDTLYPGALETSTFDGKLAGINYSMTVYASWYSKALFDQHGWEPPTTWDEALALGAEAKKEGKFLYLWGKEAANYYMTMVLDSAIKEGGDEVRTGLGNLEPDTWSHDAVQGAFEGLKAIVDAGYVKPGGAGTVFTAAQAQWSQAQEALMYPSGSWIENEMKAQTKQGFQMTGAPNPAVSSSPELGLESIHAEAGELYVVPSQAKNPAAGKELVRIMLSEEAAANFASTTFALPIVDGVVPADGFGSTALQSQVAMIDASADSSFAYNFYDVYGFGDTSNVVFNAFLSGDMSVEEATSMLQKFADKIREDDSITKTEVS